MKIKTPHNITLTIKNYKININITKKWVPPKYTPQQQQQIRQKWEQTRNKNWRYG